MFYEVERMLERGDRVILTGLKGTGKSTLISKLSGKFNSFRSMWYCSQYTSKELLDKYQLFDRCNYIDRYAFQYHTEDALDICIENFKDEFKDTYVVLMLYDKWCQLRDYKNEFSDLNRRKEVIYRFLRITSKLYREGIIKGLVVNTHTGWWSTDYADIDTIEESVTEEYLNG